MNTTPPAYDMSRNHRLIYVEGELVRGTFDVLLPTGKSSNKCWVGTHDVVVYHTPERHSGRVLHSGDLKGSVTDGVADLRTHMIAEDRRDDVLAVLDDMKAAMVAAAEVALSGSAS